MTANVRKRDIFRKKKGIHLQLDIDTHTLLRRELFTVGLTMQEVFEAFAQLVATGDFRAKRLVDSFVTDKIKREIDINIASANEISKFGEFDTEKIYNLISDASLVMPREREDDKK